MKMKLGLRGAELEKIPENSQPVDARPVVWSWVCGFEKEMEKRMGDVGLRRGWRRGESEFEESLCVELTCFSRQAHSRAVEILLLGDHVINI
ncbi:hypothetical protein QYF36_023103 [Acer negundo]|nr:hypothetical protein QYF36_023103 [Acer negundo]